MEGNNCLSQKTNGSAHLYKDSSYAHFSQITEANKHRFPALSNASPRTFNLRAGDALFIPAGWWHWVKSFGDRCISVNYWFSFPIADEPKSYRELVSNWIAQKRWTNEFLVEVSEQCNPDGVWIWRDQFAYRERISMRKFIELYSVVSGERTKEFAYLITLSDYECSLSANNRQLIDVLAKDIAFPFAEDVETYGCNFWMNFGGIDTGLHYDDEDGLLCVVDGTKQVTLYPPSDSIYLAPYSVDPVELLRNGRQFMYNLYKDLGPLPVAELDIDSSSLLEISLRKAPNLAAYARKLQERFGAGRIVYGIKNCQGVIKWEFYFYGIDRTCNTYQERKFLFSTPAYNSDLNLPSYLQFHRSVLGFETSTMMEDIRQADALQGLVVFSVDFDEETAMTGSLSKLNLYRVPAEQIQVPFVLAEYSFFNKDESIINSVQYIDLFEKTFADTTALKDKCLKVGMKADDIENLVTFCNGSPYKCKAVSLVNKGKEIGIYFFGICYQAFVNFLIKYHYPPELTNLLLKHPSQISLLQLEVGFHFLKGSNTALPWRTAFYGLF